MRNVIAPLAILCGLLCAVSVVLAQPAPGPTGGPAANTPAAPAATNTPTGGPAANTPAVPAATNTPTGGPAANTPAAPAATNAPAVPAPVTFDVEFKSQQAEFRGEVKLFYGARLANGGKTMNIIISRSAINPNVMPKDFLFVQVDENGCATQIPAELAAIFDMKNKKAIMGTASGELLFKITAVPKSAAAEEKKKE